MRNTVIIDILRSAFNLEIANEVICKNNSLIASLSDGTKATISTKKVV